MTRQRTYQVTDGKAVDPIPINPPVNSVMMGPSTPAEGRVTYVMQNPTPAYAVQYPYVGSIQGTGGMQNINTGYAIHYPVQPGPAGVIPSPNVNQNGGMGQTYYPNGSVSWA